LGKKRSISLAIINNNNAMEESIFNLKEQFLAIFQFSPIATVLLNKEGVFIESNQAFQELLGYRNKELQSLVFSEFIHPDDRMESVNRFQELLAGKWNHFSSLERFFRKDGETFWGNLSANIVHDANRLPQYAIATIQTSSEIKQAQLDLQADYHRLKRQLTEQAAELVRANTRLEQERNECQKVRQTLRTQEEFLQTLINLYSNTIFVKGSFAIVTDASTLEAMESELQQTKEQLRAVLDAMPGFVCWVSSEGQYLGVNQYMADTFDLAPESFVGQKLSFLKNSAEFAQFMSEFLAGSASTGHHVVEAQVNGSTRHYLIAAQKYLRDSLAVSVGIDITERKQAEAQIQASLQEKEVLLQEIHHRVKNNLQVISSLLDLQSQQIEESAMLEVFRESQNRVKSMALVHEKLYQSKNFAIINFAEYTESLTNYLFKAYELNAGDVTLELDIDEVSLNIDTAIPCGLIINELVSNALKYAFPDRRTGTIRVALHADRDRHFTMIVEDNGVGFSLEFDLNKVKSLGFQLVNVLAKQLKGSLEIDQTNGSKFQVRFSEIHS
jgi:PAS domain S-box-containing protein